MAEPTVTKSPSPFPTAAPEPTTPEPKPVAETKAPESDPLDQKVELSVDLPDEHEFPLEVSVSGVAVTIPNDTFTVTEREARLFIEVPFIERVAD